MFDPNRDRSIARQLACETASQWYELMPGTVPIQAIQALSREQQASRRNFRDVLLDNIERGALIFIDEEDRVAIREALAAAGRTVPKTLAEPGFPPGALGSADG
jgi:hypothetical protein